MLVKYYLQVASIRNAFGMLLLLLSLLISFLLFFFSSLVLNCFSEGKIME